MKATRAEKAQPERSRRINSEEMKSVLRNVIGTEDAGRILGVTQHHIELLLRKKVLIGKRLNRHGHGWAVWLPSVLHYQRHRPRRGKKPKEIAS